MDGGIFDYVIVGAGSAGCVLANRLSEERGTTVALVEAGGRDTNPWIHIPAGFYRNIFNPAVSWQFGSGPEPHLDGRTVPWPRGRVLGGSSAINGLLYVRGQAQDFDVWRQLGNVGWSFQDVLPYFKRAEDQERGADELHGAGGPLRRLRRTPAPAPAVRCLHRCLRGSRHPAQRRLQRRLAGGSRLLSAHQPQRPARLHRRRLPAAGPLPGQPADHHGRPGARHRAGRPARHRHPLRARRPYRDHRGPARGDPRRRRHRLAAHHAAVGHRPRRGAGGCRGARAVRSGRRRREPAGPPAGALHL